MGRHSIPHPGDSAGDESQTGRRGYQAAESDQSGASEASGGRGPDGEWTGSHRAVQARRRGVSVGVIAALVLVVVVVTGVIVWQFFGDTLDDRSGAAAARCVEGQLAVAVVTDPSIAEQVTVLADKYNETAGPVGDKCVKVGVRPAEPDQLISGLTGDWPAELGQRPALWIPASSASTVRLEAAAGPEVVSDSRSLVSSPVLLAVRPELGEALAQQNWATLPMLQSEPTALDKLNLPGWGSLRLALPLTGDADASVLAAEAVAAASAPDGDRAGAGVAAVRRLVAGAPKLADSTASTAMDALRDAPDPAGAEVHAVATTEQQLFQRAASLPDATDTLSAWLPPGPVALADYPTALLGGDWLSQEDMAAASEFARFMRKPEQLAEFTAAGFRSEGAATPQSDVTTFPTLPAPLSFGDDAIRVEVADAVTAPVEPPAVTIVLDRSMTVAEGDNTRMGNVVNALIDQVRELPVSTGLGLWTFDGVEGQAEVPLGPLGDPIDGRPRSEVLIAVLDEQSSTGGGAVSFTTLRLVYNQAKAEFREGQANSVLMITAGPHTDRTLDGAGLEAFIREAFDPARPVAVNVIDFGDDPDRPTWEAVAQTSGGRYQNLPTSASPELSAAIRSMLGY